MSKLGKDTIETLEAYRTICHAGVRVVLDENGLDSKEDSDEFILTVLEAVQEKKARRSNIVRQGDEVKQSEKRYSSMKESN